MSPTISAQKSLTKLLQKIKQHSFFSASQCKKQNKVKHRQSSCSN